MAKLLDDPRVRMALIVTGGLAAIGIGIYLFLFAKPPALKTQEQRNEEAAKELADYLKKPVEERNLIYIHEAMRMGEIAPGTDCDGLKQLYGRQASQGRIEDANVTKAQAKTAGCPWAQ